MDRREPGRRRPLRARVDAVVDVGERMRELRLQGPELARLRCSPGAHVTVSVPDEAVTVRRVYSVWDSDPVAALRLRIALHDGGGPGCAWVLAARPGDEVTLEPPRSKITIDPRAAYNLFVGDETGAVPLLAMHAAAGMFVASRAPHRHLAWINTMIFIQLLDWVATLFYLSTGDLTFRQVSTASFLPVVFITPLLWWHPRRGARVRSTYRTLYRVGLMPWNRAMASGPISAWADGRPPGVAVDLGCGTGADARHLAGLGWQVTAVDYVPRAIAMARQHDRKRQVLWRIGDVTAEDQVDPDGVLAAACDLVVDNGCLHGIPTAARKGWAATVNHLAMSGAALLVRAAPPRHRGIGPAGIATTDIATLLGDGWLELGHPALDWRCYQRSGPNRRPNTECRDAPPATETG